MHIELEVVAARGDLSIWVESKHRKSAGSRERLNFTVVLRDQDRLELSSGHILMDPDSAFKKEDKEKLIEAFLNVYPAQEDDRASSLQYFGPEKIGQDDHGASVYFEINVERPHFEELRSHVLAGHPPTTISLEFPHEGFTFGWHPDGSDKKWDVVANRTIPILGSTFNFQYMRATPSASEFWKDPEERDDFQDSTRVGLAVLRKLDRLQKTAKEGLWIVGIAAALILWALST